MNISLVMIVKDEERTLKSCLKAAAPLVDEMIVVDTGSSDRTREIAKASGASVFDFTWCHDFSAARNFALDHACGEWNLVLDADEILRPCTREVLEQSIHRLSAHYASDWMGALTRYDVYPGGEGNEISVTALPRLFPAAVRYQGRIHEQPSAKLPCFRLPLEADHDGYLLGDKGERNLSYLLQAVKDEPEDNYYRFQLGATLRNLGQLTDALEQFRIFWQCGDSAENGYRAEGVLLYLYTLLDLGNYDCLMEAWKVIEHERPHLRDRADYWFVCGLFYMKLVLIDTEKYLSYLPFIETSYLTCLDIGEHPEKGGVVGTGSFKAAYNLGLWYELSGRREKADEYYRKAAEWGYEPARKRMSGEG